MRRTANLLALCLLTLALDTLAQVKIADGGFERANVGAVPDGWFVPQVIAATGFTAAIVDQNCHAGERCVLLTGGASAEDKPGNLMQTISAAGYTSHRIRLRAAIRVEGVNTRCQMWLRLDRSDNSMSFLDNMSRRPVRSPDWKIYDTETNVPDDVTRIAFGFLTFGAGKVWVDDVSLENLQEVRKDQVEPPRPLTPQGLTNLTAFTKLYGYVRFFHPSDQGAAADWDRFAIEGVRKIESAAGTSQLIDRLNDIFHPVAPTAFVYSPSHPPPPPAPPTDLSMLQIVRYWHNGVGLAVASNVPSIYRTERRRTPAQSGQMPKPFEAEIAPGVRVSVPLAIYADNDGTLPRISAVPPAVVYEQSAADRSTRLAGVVIAWNVFQHFYPYFDVVKTDWPAALSQALGSAAADDGIDAFQNTLQRLVAALRDGHGNVVPPRFKPTSQPPVTLDWVQNQLLITRTRKEGAAGLAPGDRVLKIDGKPVGQASAEVRALISAATDQWMRYRSANELSKCNPETNHMSLEIEPYANRGTTATVDLVCQPPRYRNMETYTEPRPEKIAELEPDILYVDLDRVTEDDWTAVIPRLEKARGIIFDMRGYPSQPGLQAVAHITDTTLRSAQWNVSSAAMPDRLDSPFHETDWELKPEQPYFTARRVFLTDGRAISYAETVMGIVEHYKLADIIGEPTAGTNGNVNPFTLPGGFTINWTGMKVLKHDGSQHHGVGILPTVPVSRTREGVAEGKDEILLKAISVVKSEK